jgi:hypothetical protein
LLHFVFGRILDNSVLLRDQNLASVRTACDVGLIDLLNARSVEEIDQHFVTPVRSRKLINIS